jgi:hypothetical protein
MKKNVMDDLWNGPIINSLEVNKWKQGKGNTYKMTMKVFREIEIDTFVAEGFFKKESDAKNSLDYDLRKMREEKYPWKDNKDICFRISMTKI